MEKATFPIYPQIWREQVLTLMKFMRSVSLKHYFHMSAGRKWSVMIRWRSWKKKKQPFWTGNNPNHRKSNCNLHGDMISLSYSSCRTTGNFRILVFTLQKAATDTQLVSFPAASPPLPWIFHGGGHKRSPEKQYQEILQQANWRRRGNTNNTVTQQSTQPCAARPPP